MSVLSRLPRWLTPGGHLHIIEMFLPGDRSIAQLLAKWDRGKHVRPLDKWRNLFQQHMDIVVFESYSIRLLGTTLWNMLYCKGRAIS
jgi:hypothetical protein